MPIRTRRAVLIAAGLAAGLGAGLVSPLAAAQEPDPPEAEASGPPALTSLRLARTVRAQRGHARFLVGIRTSVAAQIIIRVSAASSGELLKTVQASESHPAGRAYFLVDATDDDGFQLPSGAYRVEVQATSETTGTSEPVRSSFRLRLARGRGRFDAYTIPLWKVLTRTSGLSGTGQLVAVVAPRGAAAKAGIRRGDVLVSLNGRPIDSPGSLVAAQRALPAGREVPVVVTRAGERLELRMTPPPDWETAPSYDRSLRVATRRDPKSLALAAAAVRERIEADEAESAERLLAGWPRSWRASAVGHLLAGEMLTAEGRHKPALGAYNRARKRDPNIEAASFGRGVALAALKRPGDSVGAFGAAERLDPKDAAAAAFRAYVLLRIDRGEEAVQAAQRSIRIDPRYADAHLPHGIAQLALENRAAGVRGLRTGLLLLDDEERAARLIARHLEPTDP